MNLDYRYCSKQSLYYDMEIVSLELSAHTLVSRPGRSSGGGRLACTFENVIVWQ
jgi:hypothetical protein